MQPLLGFQLVPGSRQWSFAIVFDGRLVLSGMMTKAARSSDIPKLTC